MDSLKDISIVLAGEAGQGINTVAETITTVAQSTGMHVFCTTEYMSRIRGGMNSTIIRLANNRIMAPSARIDILVPLNERAITHLQDRISNKTLIIGEYHSEQGKFIQIPLRKLVQEIGGSIYLNTISAGIISNLLNISLDLLIEYLSSRFKTKGSEILSRNIEAAKLGYRISQNIKAEFNLTTIETSEEIRNEKIMDGSEAIALGAIAGGCNFIAAYPMTPSSGVWTYLAQHSTEFGIITEQSEDEISAMNMGIGASYAGARALVTTSGGGFDLMTEGLSLAGIQETPIVIHLAQRPGPATGLPTRTEQSDLELALYAGHGEFPRVILAPGTLEQGFLLTRQAFQLAEKYQVPVFVLTDQYFIDSFYNVPKFNFNESNMGDYTVKPTNDYKRYLLTDSGVSPRAIPGLGATLVIADCHHHDEEGHISEDLKLRTRMVDKLFHKMEKIKQEVMDPELYGSKDYETLIICWGSNYGVVKESIDRLKMNDIAMLHFSQVFPLPQSTPDFLKKAKNLVIVENNATSQFGKLINLYTGIEIKQKLLKYNGLPFFVEEICEGIKKCLTR